MNTNIDIDTFFFNIYFFYLKKILYFKSLYFVEIVFTKNDISIQIGVDIRIVYVKTTNTY